MNQESAYGHSAASQHTGCRELFERASEYLEVSLTPEEIDHLRRHLDACRNCRSFVATLQETISLLKTLPSKTLPPDLKARLLQACKEATA
ncbi:MAG: zf-HC2 domain-containing protein [Chloroflexi bacterium]|nr:zf-HC2 domain-containing protein [Chloroflexota bacterium]